MLCDTVEIDDDLFAAQDARRLVVFVGAGVSMAPPSNLPSFGKLVDQISKGVPILDAPPNLPFDVRLQRLVSQGVNVHERCHRLITVASSKPNQLHESILRLFQRSEDIRIVTTNFDKHLLRSAKKLKLKVPMYCAPALPLGGDFHGIVHLHGSVDDPSGMILTEGNFGSAYITDGYAARFLRELFATYTVLFVGYSHSDPPMNYFNQGLGARRQRHYILTADDNPTQWGQLRLTPLLYVAKGKDHSKLRLALRDWADQTKLRPTQVAARLQQILANPKVLSRSQEGFLLRHYNREHTVGAFVKHAQLFDWVRWLHQKGLVRPLLNNPLPGPTEGIQAHWLGTLLARDDSGTGLSIVEDCGGVLNFVAARAILVEILHTVEKTRLTVAQKHWLLLLLRQSPSTYLDVFASLVSALRRWDEWELALQIVTFLVTPTVRMPSDARPNPHFTGSGPFPVLIGEHYDLTQSFDSIMVFAGKDSVRKMELLRVLEQSCQKLGEQCVILRLNNHHHPGLVSFESILTSDRYNEDPMGALIAFTCRTALDLAPTGLIGKETFIRWMDSKNQILIRGALLAMAQAPLTPSEVLGLLISHDGLFPLAFYPDPERDPLVHSIFPKLTTAEKTAYLNAVKRGPSSEWEDGAPDE